MVIEKIRVLVDPYREVCHNLRKKLLGYDKIEQAVKEQKAKEYHNDTLKSIFQI